MTVLLGGLIEQVPTAARERPRQRVGPGISRQVLERARLLLPHERTLLELHLEGASLSSIARAMGISSGTACRRLSRIVTRLRNPLIGVLLESHCPLPCEHRQVGIEHFLLGLSARHIAEKHQMNERHVRAILAFLKVWHTGAGASP
jgi:DNA-directed RNA polymerase specialized sigma24 family protein